MLSQAPLLALFTALSPQAEPAPAPVRVVSLDLAAHPDFDWRAADLDVYIAPRPGGHTLEVLADDAELERLRNLGLSPTIVQADLGAFYRSRFAPAPLAAGSLGAWLTPPFAAGAMGGYYTFAELQGVLDQIAAAHPSIATAKASLGSSIEGRPLWMIKVSDNPSTDENEPEVRFDALHHAREPESMQVSLWFLLWLVEGYGNDPLATYLVDHRELFFVPCVNPDGYVYNQTTAPGGGGLWRKNRRNLGGGDFGVDLNRNYSFQWGYDDEGSSPSKSSDTYRGSAPASEPEVQAMTAFLTARDFKTALSLHTFSDLWMHAYGYDFVLPANEAQYAEVGALQTVENGYVTGPIASTLYLANGGTTDYEHAVHGTLAFTPEIGGDADGFWPATARIVPLAEENLLGLQRTALAAGAFVHAPVLLPTEVGNGDGFFVPGEGLSIALTARNSGLAATSGAVTASLSSASPAAVIVDGAHSFGALAPFTEASTGATPLRLDVAPGTPPGTSIPYTLALSAEGYTQVFPGALVVGLPHPFIADDLEVDLGWTAGVPGDTASSGQWVLGNPVGTSSSGEPAEPEDDASPAGTRCFSTGNGGGSAGTDDVDNGHVTLISPRLDLSGVGPALLSYSRWFADLSVEDDAFAVSISEDDGATWVPLETVPGNANAWNKVSVLVTDLVAQTAEVRLRFVAEDDPNNSVVEAAVDELNLAIYDLEPRLNVYGKPALAGQVAVNVAGAVAAPYAVFYSIGTGSLTIPGITGSILLNPAAAFQLLSGSVPGGGLAKVVVPLPSAPVMSGVTVHLQGLVLGAAPGFTNLSTLTFE
jgi:hypothetical protein